MRHFHKAKNQLHCPIVNLDKIWSLVGEEVRSYLIILLTLPISKRSRRGHGALEKFADQPNPR